MQAITSLTRTARTRTARSIFSTPKRRIAFVAIVAAAVWGAMVICQGLRAPSNMPDWALMSEVGRRVALGDTLYVDAMDQKGPLCYGAYALVWLLVHTPANVYLASNILIWVSLVADSVIAARMVEDEQKPWAHLLAQMVLAAVLFVPHVGCIELWLAPFGLLAAMWVKRLAAGHEVHDACWAVVGLSAAFAVGAKFTTAAQFVFLVCYATSRQNTKGLARACAIALVTCAIAVGATLLWVWAGGSLEGMIQHHIHAASDGYAERMSMLEHIASGNPSTTHMGSFILGLATALPATLIITLRAQGWWRRLLVLTGSVLLMTCCFATFVGYYRFQLAPLVVLGVCDTKGTLNVKLRQSHDLTLALRCVLWLASIAVIVGVTTYTCDGTSGAMAQHERLRTMLHNTIKHDNSVIGWTFGHTWIYAELGLDFPYAIPARYNASQDLWEATAGKDVADNRWRYVVVSVDNGTKVGDTVYIDGTWFPAVAVESTTAIVDAGGRANALTNPPYRIP